MAQSKRDCGALSGFAIGDDRLKNLGGGNDFKELLNRIRDVRSSEKVFYRQVLDMFAARTDHEPFVLESKSGPRRALFYFLPLPALLTKMIILYIVYIYNF